eukprot:TRINITY_DN989_c0_g1_i1.p1 TRINITY_DN989_c0_g1~~TRINITY_DN989_c0_g1_i1.p1  ORF type:complete len:158 (+),score=24.42 TRINITY_DN989_c0_g1_i1:139-612(+)
MIRIEGLSLTIFPPNFMKGGKNPKLEFWVVSSKESNIFFLGVGREGGRWGVKLVAARRLGGTILWIRWGEERKSSVTVLKKIDLAILPSVINGLAGYHECIFNTNISLGTGFHENHVMPRSKRSPFLDGYLTFRLKITFVSEQHEDSIFIPILTTLF